LPLPPFWVANTIVNMEEILEEFTGFADTPH
jgi:hypothetical protein